MQITDVWQRWQYALYKKYMKKKAFLKVAFLRTGEEGTKWCGIKQLIIYWNIKSSKLNKAEVSDMGAAQKIIKKPEIK